MPVTGLRIQERIHAAPAAVFAYVSDLTRHGEWAANLLQIEALDAGPVAVGSRYRSTAHVNGVRFAAELRVTACEPPARFAFAGRDQTGGFEHEFSFQPVAGGTLIERRIRFELNWGQWLMFQLLRYPVRLPAARRALRQLKQRLEAG